MVVISSQHYRNWERVEEHKAEMLASGCTSITLPVWAVGEYDGRDDLYVLADGHHRLEAARELGIEVRFDVRPHPEGLSGEALLEAAWMDGDWYDVETSELIW